MNKRFLSLFLASAMAATSITPAFASEVHVSEAGGTGNSRVTFEVVDTGDPEAPTVFNAYVPVVLPIKMDLDGNITVPTNAVIRNGVENKAIQVEAADVTATGGWQHTDMPTAENGVPNSRLLGLSMNSQDLKAATFPWKIEAAGSLDLNMKAEIPQQQAVNNSEQIATVAFVLDWADENESVISHNWSRDKVLKGSTTPVTISYDATFPGVSVVSVESDNPAVTVEKAPQTYDLGHPGQENWNVHAVSTGNATVTATLNTGETTSFQVVVYELGLEDGGSITVPEIPDKGEGDNLNTGDIIIDIPITTPDGDGTIEVTPIIPPDTILKPGDNEIDVTVMIDNITINITIIINIAGSNPSDGLQQSVAEAQAMGFTFSPYEDGLQIDSFENKQFKKEINVPEQIGDFKVLGIGNNAFEDQSNLTKITLPETIKKIGSYAFSGCNGLEYLNIPANVMTLGKSALSLAGSENGVLDIDSIPLIEHDYNYNYTSNMSMLCWHGNKVLLPDGLTKVGAYAFNGLSAGIRNVTSISLPGSVTSIGEAAFAGNKSLVFTVPDTDITIAKDAFSGTTVSASYNKAVSDNAFPYAAANAFVDGRKLASVNKSNLGTFGFNEQTTSIDFTKPVKGTDGNEYYISSIGTEAFYKHPSLTNVNIGGLVKIVNNSAFYYCPNLSTVTFEPGVEAILDKAFFACGELKSVELPEGLLTLGNNAFGSCSAIENVVLPYSLQTIGNGVFADSCAHDSTATIKCNIFSKKGTFEGSGISTAIIAEGVTRLDDNMFESSEGLTNVTLPSTLSSMGAAIFMNCRALESVTFTGGCPDLDELPVKAFWSASSLKSISIPENVTYIGSQCFFLCRNLSTVVIPDGVTTIHPDSFTDVPHIEYHGSASGAPWGAKSMN